jgi:tetratricopeptide (TPR) repeat protein
MKKNKKEKKIFLFFTIFIFSLILYKIICCKTEQDKYDSFNEGYSEVYKGDFHSGNKKMTNAISKLKKPNSKIYHAFSVLNTKNGNYDIAISALEKSYELDSEEGAYFGWVLLYYYHDYKRALNILNTHDDSTPKFSDWPMGECIHYLKGLAYSQLKNYEKAIEEFDISITNTTRDSGENWVDYQVFLNKGICLFNLKKYKEAIVEFKKAKKDYNNCTEAFYYIGLSQFKLNLNDLGCQNLNRANALINLEYNSKDIYVELFHEVYAQQIFNNIEKYCNNR